MVSSGGEFDNFLFCCLFQLLPQSKLKVNQKRQAAIIKKCDFQIWSYNSTSARKPK